MNKDSEIKKRQRLCEEKREGEREKKEIKTNKLNI
jgi:hypothetical protein